MERRTDIKIGVLCLPGLQSFLKDIVEHLSFRYRVRTCYSIKPQTIQETIQWADVVWLEWANELAIGITKNPELLNGKKVICRLHSYEAFEDYLEKIDWRKIDDLVFVASHIREIAIDRFPALSGRVKRMHIIPNGIDFDRFSFYRRHRGYRLAFIGDINYKKGPMLLLHAFRELVQVDDRYTLHVAGRLQNARYALYFSQMIRELKLEANIQMDGWVDNIQNWLQDKQYVVCSSVLEGHPVGIMEAMACGLKPVIHNFVGARQIYPQDFLWNTIPEFIHQVTSNDYDSNAYRDYIKNNFSLGNQLEKIDRLIVEPTHQQPDDISLALNQPINAQNLSAEPVSPVDQSYVPVLHPQVRETLGKCIRPGMKVLCVGYGGGEIVEHIGSLGAQVLCLDESEPVVFRAQNQSKTSNVRYCQREFDDLQLEEKYDLISIVRVMEQMPDSRISKFMASIARHATDATIIYLNMVDGRYLRYSKGFVCIKEGGGCESYTPDVVLGLFAGCDFQPYHIAFYGEDVPVEYNEYLFATDTAFSRTCRRVAVEADHLP